MLDDDDLLAYTAQAVELDPTRRARAESAYPEIAGWLCAEDSPLAAFAPEVFPQGSIPLGTTIKPVEDLEFDVDAVIALAFPRQASPGSLLELIERRLAAHGVYSGRLERKSRCIRIHYADGFHVDVIGANRIRDSLYVASETGDHWERTAPKEYVAWYQARALSEVRASFRADIEPLPVAVPDHLKPQLTRIVQLTKRARDMYFCDRDFLPASIMLTTIGGIYAPAAPGLLAGLDLLQNASHSIACQASPWLENPVNPGENLARRLTDPEAREAFLAFADWFGTQLTRLKAAQGLDEKCATLGTLFGEAEARLAMRNAAQRLTDLRSNRSLRFDRAGAAALTTVAGARPFRNDFHGTEHST